jgi:hypothetical protein
MKSDCAMSSIVLSRDVLKGNLSEERRYIFEYRVSTVDVCCVCVGDA